MKHFINALLSLGLIFGNPALAQNNIDLFADVKNNDTLRALVNIFTDELKKSSPGVNLTIQPAASYSGKGFYFSPANTSGAIKPSPALQKAGVEAFSIDANEQTVKILGNCNMAVGHGIFSYLELLGYRYYFANKDWYIIPSKPALFRKWAITSSPSFYHRRIWYGYGTGSKIADADYNFWVLANKLGGSVNASFGHSYEEIVSHHKDAFLQHPDWFYPVAPKGVIPVEAKFDMSKEDLVQIVIQDVETRIEASLKDKTNAYKMISLSPSDGLGTCNSPACQQLGTMTDRVYYLTNRVAKAIQKKYPSSLIGCLAYGEYSSPPTKNVEPNVYVGITTAFNGSKFTTERLVDEWRKKGAMIGIYDYFSWFAWDFDVPGQSLASKPTDMVNTLKKYYNKGVRNYEGESSIGLVSKGLGYYLTAKQMWDINADAAAEKKEFFKLCFKKAADLMEKLWNEWENYSFTTIREGDLGHWIDYITEAERIEKDPDVKKRFFQIKSYLHYLYLYHNYQANKAESTLLPLLNFGYRKLDDGSVAGYPAFFVLGGGSKIPGMGYDNNAKWRNNNSPVTFEEMDRLMTEDRGKLKVPEPIKNYAPANKFINVPGLDRYTKMIADSIPFDNAYWYTNEWVLEIKNKSSANFIDFTGNYIADPTVTRPIKISVYPFAADGNVSARPAIISYDYTATKVKERISLAQLSPGYYTMLIEDPVKIFRFSFSPSVNYSMVMRPSRQIRVPSLTYAFIYVPEGVKRFNVIKSSLLEFITPTGRTVSYKTDKPEDVQVEVQNGEAGLWRIKPIYGQLYIEGIPPYVGISARQMLIPAGIK